MQYEARLRFQMDEAGRQEQARMDGLIEGEAKGFREGEAKGLREGALLGRIGLLQELLGVNSPSSDELATYDESRLSELADDLQQQLRTRGPIGGF